MTDEFDEDQVITFVKRYRDPDGINYSYAAIKAGDYWYVTNGNRYTWDNLLKFIAQDNLYEVNMWEAGSWERYLPES